MSKAPSAPPLGLIAQLELLLPLPDVSDIPLRDYQETMQRPFFSLSKKKRQKPILYTSPDGKVSVEVQPNNAYGMATIWDADILIFLASYVNEQRQKRSNDVGQTIKVQPIDLLRRIGWGTSGRAYERLTQALDRLQSTTIKTNIRAENRRESVFSWIESYTHLVCEKTNRPLGMEITLSKWLFDGLQEKNLLSISPRYFDIGTGLGKWLYRAARKHAGGNGPRGFTIGIDTLHEKSGSERSSVAFKKAIGELVDQNDLPDIHLELIKGNMGRPQLRMVMRSEMEKPLLVSEPTAAAAPSPALPDIRAKAVATATPPAPEKGNPSRPGVVSSLGDIAAQAIAQAAKLNPALAAHEGFQSNKDKRRQRGRPSADRVIDQATLAELRAEFGGWDFDELLESFDNFLDVNPDELPANYSRRFKGFVATHDARHGHLFGRYKNS